MGIRDEESIFEAQRSGTSTDDLIKQRIQGAASATNTGAGFFTNDPYSQFRVYMGSASSNLKKVGPLGIPQAAPFAPGVTPTAQQDKSYMSYGEAVLAPTTWSDAQLKAFVNKGIINKVPGFDTGMGMPQIQAAWQSLVQSSVMYNDSLKAGQTPWTPNDVLDTYGAKKGQYGTVRQGDWVFDVATGERIKYVGATSKTTTSKNVDLSSPEQAQALVTQVLREAIGRAPTAKELAKFKSTISGYEQANPTVTTTTQQLSPNLATGAVDVTDQSSVTSGGVTDAARAALVQNPTEDTKEYGKYQSGTTYFNALMQMIGGS